MWDDGRIRNCGSMQTQKLPFQDVIDAQATDDCMLVLCANNNDILYMIIKQIGLDHIQFQMISQNYCSFFTKTTNIYSTTN